MAPQIPTAQASVTVTETKAPIGAALKELYQSNRDVILIVSAVTVALLINRRMLRRELTHINFQAEFYPEDIMGNELFEGASEYIG